MGDKGSQRNEVGGGGKEARETGSPRRWSTGERILYGGLIVGGSLLAVDGTGRQALAWVSDKDYKDMVVQTVMECNPEVGKFTEIDTSVRNIHGRVGGALEAIIGGALVTGTAFHLRDRRLEEEG